MTLNRKVITQVGQVLAITYVYGGCQCIKMGCHFMRTQATFLALVDTEKTPLALQLEEGSTYLYVRVRSI